MANPKQDELKALREKLEGIIRLIQDLRHIGRPPGSNIILEVEPVLLASLQNGLNKTQACLQAGVSRAALYLELDKNPPFLDRIEKAEQFGTMIARQNIVKAINAGDVATSKWHLERKDPEYKQKTDITSDDKPLRTALVEFVGDDGTTTENPS